MRVLGLHPCLVNQLDRLDLGEESEVKHGKLSGYLLRAMVEEGRVGGQVGRQLQEVWWLLLWAVTKRIALHICDKIEIILILNIYQLILIKGIIGLLSILWYTWNYPCMKTKTNQDMYCVFHIPLLLHTSTLHLSKLSKKTAGVKISVPLGAYLAGILGLEQMQSYNTYLIIGFFKCQFLYDNFSQIL